MAFHPLTAAVRPIARLVHSHPRPRPLLRNSTIACLLASLVLLAQWAAGGSGWLSPTEPPAAEAATTRIKMPFPANQSWRVSQGYNTSTVEGGSHWNCDPNTLKDAPSQTRTCRAPYQYKYSLDLARADGNTAGEQVLSPVDGTIRWIDEVAGGMSINLGDGYAVAFFHANLAAGLVDGQPVTQGQVLGTVAPAGQAGNGGFAHIHFTVWQTIDGGNWSRNAVPFTGANKADGFDFPALAESSRNQHRNAAISSTNSGTATSVPAAPSRISPATGTVIPGDNAYVDFDFNSAANATGYQVVVDGTIFSPWLSGTDWKSGLLPAGSHRWQVRARNGDTIGPLSSEWVFTIQPSTTTTPTPTTTPPPSATPAVTLSTTQGSAAAIVTVGGTGFRASEQVSLRWDSATAAPLTTIAASSSGAFSTQVTIPDATRGAHTVYATGGTSGGQASAIYTIAASLSRTPYEGIPGTQVAVTARGFGPNEGVTVTWQTATGPTLGTATSNSAGTATQTITIPDSGFGWTDYTAVGATSGIRAYGAIQVLPNTTVSPTSTAPGQQVTVSGRGFPASRSITAAWNKSSTNVGSQLCAGTTSASGTYSCTFNAPAQNAGTYPVTLTSSDGMARSANVSVTGPTAVTVSPTSGAVGTNITATAGGFGANESINFTWDGTTWQTVNADSNGSVTVRATVPQLSTGARTLQARGASSRRSASATFTVNTTASAGTTSMVSPGTYVVTATREGLVGGTTSNGHVIVPDDHFASLPGCLASNCPWLRPGVRDAKWGTRTECGENCFVLVVNPANNSCQVAEVWDVGPWFRVDDWWNTTSKRHLNTLPTTKNILAQGYTGTDAARNGLDVGFGIGPNGIGSSEKYLEVGNRAAIDLGDGTWTDLGLDFQRGIASGIRVSLLWQTGQDPQAAMNSCNRGVVPSSNLSVSTSSGAVGASVTVSGGGFRAGERVDLFWDATSGTPLLSQTASSAGSFSATVQIPAATGGRHTLAAIGATSRTRANGTFDVTASLARTPTGGPPGTAIQVSVSGYGANESVKLTWNSPSGPLLGTVGTDARGSGTATITIPNDTAGWHDYTGFGYTSRLRAYGAINVVSSAPPPSTQTHPPGTANLTFGGAKLAVVGSSGTPGGTSTSLVHDGAIGWSWDLTSSPRPTSGFVTLDLGATRPLSGIRWAFRVSGGADAMTVATSNDNRTWLNVGTFGNAPAKVWHGVATGGSARYVRFTFANPNNDAKIGYLAEAEVWGGTGTVPTYPPGTANPSFSGQKLSVASSSGSATANSASSVHDGNTSTVWKTSGAAPANAAFTLDLGATRAMSGVKWRFSASGGASEMLVQTSTDGQSWRTVGRYGNAAANTWYGQASPRDARFVRFTFYNRFYDPALGNVSEVEVWGTSGVATARVAQAPRTAADTPTASPTATEAASPTLTATLTPTPEPTSTPEPTTAPTETPEPTATTAPTETPTPQATAEPTPTLPPVLVTGTITGTGGDGAVCRGEPSTDGERLAVLPEGASVGLTGNAVNDFYPVICADQAGYVSFQFVTLPGQERAPAETPPAAEAAPTPELTQREITIPVSGDTSVTAALPDAPQPSEERTALPAGGQSGAVAVLTFEVSGVAAGTVVEAQLVLPGAGDAAAAGGTLAVLPSTWVDADLASYTPVMDAGPAAVTDIGTIVAGESAVVDVTGVVTSDGYVTFLVLGTPDQVAVLASSESGSPAILVLTVEEVGLSD